MFPSEQQRTPQPTDDFLGTDRFKIRRRLGSGGMGVVYEAHDRETDKLVALKALTHTEATHISRFRNEFRSLADVSHPNLVTLYEFMSDGESWFFTMELVRGVNFLQYVGDPTQVERQGLGIWVVLFLLAFTAIAWMLKTEYWKDVR